MLILFSILQLIHCSCPKGFELVREGECRGNYTRINIVWDDALTATMAKCEEINGLPIIIHDEADQKYWTNRVASSLPYTVIGLTCNTTTKQWVWVDGSPLDYKPPTYNLALDDDCTIGNISEIHPDGFWGFNYGQKSDKTDVLCSTKIEHPVPSADGCDSFEDDSEDGVCYQVGAGAQNWQGAQLSCRQLGANLASIHSQQENSFVRRLAVSKGLVNGLYLGATISGKGKDFGWIDGTEWDYENFRPGFPMNGFGQCLSMDTSTSAGQWMNVDCAAELPVACIRDQRPVLEPTCAPGPWAEGELITSPGYPFNATTPCDYFLIVEAGKKVEAIVSVEANSCCDYLTFYEGDVGGTMLANLTGEVHETVIKTKTSNIMRVDWQPKDGMNVRGFLMSFRGFLH